ncbi:hypothetical protein WMY93_006801 [Mugilogobius chulae]|uniref:Uncharacterized protein n=1 Tax=Mugilogobius chulae TaxID=88201 RepID=A0AAW0PPM7_9GOBI
MALVLLWSGLRTLMVSFYFSAGPGPGPGLYWVLYGLPVCLQFMSLSLMTLYCAQVYLKAKSKSSPILLQYRPLLYLFFSSSVLVFVVVNLVCGLLVRSGSGPDLRPVRVLVLIRVLVNDSLFVLCAVALAFCLHKVARMSLTIGLNAKGPSVCQLTLVGVALVLVYGSRTSYNLTVLSLTDHSPESQQSHWFHVTDQADLCSRSSDSAVLVLGLVLFVWELLPSALAVFVFRVRKPPQHLVNNNTHLTPGPLPHVLSSRRYFFDNPHRYDSDEDLSWSHAHIRASSDCDFGDEQRLTASSGELHHYP